MKLKFDTRPSGIYRHGYWYASTDNDEFDADGQDPLEAVTRLAIVLEEELSHD